MTSTDAGAKRGARLRIAVVPKGTTHEFWKSVHAGAVKASRELDVDIVWKGPLREDDLKAQIDVVSSFVAQGVSGIALAPLNGAALKAPVRAATQANIPVVVFDSDLAGDEHVSFVATDNQAAGKLAGEHLGKAIGGKGNIVVLRYQEGSASTQNREAGFLDAVRAMPGITVASENQYGGATTETAFNKSESLLLAHKAAEGAIAGVFTPNESTTFGMLQALRKTNVAKKVKFVGFDASEKLLGALREGDIEALVVQNPFNMGYVAIKTMVAHLRGEAIEKRIDTGARVVTKQDLDDPAVQEIVNPDLARWLGE
ncbi:substrate-binding domain-containing protein [Sorangium sp. So ce260]|uniref:ABC transporter substrate-binding protein n=1 Tax=Sorangium sp. So ce260 TaxID=3133291 RepID=UPI003F605C21